MGLRFIRKPSDTPNVQNSDDTRMIRYAYGGYDGYVQNRGNELNHTINGLDFVIGTGVVSLQGYETEVDAQGWLMTVTNSPTKHYYSVYYEVNLATQTTDIKHKVSTSGYPDIPTNDDLTQTTTGVANLLLYRFEATSGVISNVQKVVKAIPYAADIVADIEQRLDSLGFRQGSVPLTIAGVDFGTATLKRQGNYVIADISKSILTSYASGPATLGTLPPEFRPKEEVHNSVSGSGYYSGAILDCKVAITLRTDGSIYMGTPTVTLLTPTGPQTDVCQIRYFNTTIGYEAITEN